MEDKNMLPTVLRRRNTLSDSWLDDLLNTGFLPASFSERTLNRNAVNPAVNIMETGKEYLIDVAAPGIDKNAFSVNLDSNILTVSVNQETQDKSNAENYLCQEFDYSSFKRTFTLPKNADNSKIKASYKNGVLSVVIPKNKPVEKIHQEIKIN